jgi:hypothetical protein
MKPGRRGAKVRNVPSNTSLLQLPPCARTCAAESAGEPLPRRSRSGSSGIPALSIELLLVLQGQDTNLNLVVVQVVLDVDIGIDVDKGAACGRYEVEFLISKGTHVSLLGFTWFMAAVVTAAIYP